MARCAVPGVRRWSCCGHLIVQMASWRLGTSLLYALRTCRRLPLPHARHTRHTRTHMPWYLRAHAAAVGRAHTYACTHTRAHTHAHVYMRLLFVSVPRTTGFRIACKWEGPLCRDGWLLCRSPRQRQEPRLRPGELGRGYASTRASSLASVCLAPTLSGTNVHEPNTLRLARLWLTRSYRWLIFSCLRLTC